MADLSKYDTLNAVERPTKFQMLDWDDVPTDISFTVYGVGSKIYTQYHNKLERQSNAAASRGKPLDTDAMNELWCEVLARCTTAWENVEENGKPVEFSYDNAFDIYLRYPFFRNQVMKNLMAVRSFLE